MRSRVISAAILVRQKDATYQNHVSVYFKLAAACFEPIVQRPHKKTLLLSGDYLSSFRQG